MGHILIQVSYSFRLFFEHPVILSAMPGVLFSSDLRTAQSNSLLNDAFSVLIPIFAVYGIPEEDVSNRWDKYECWGY